jgi:hypothetical protein
MGVRAGPLTVNVDESSVRMFKVVRQSTNATAGIAEAAAL